MKRRTFCSACSSTSSFSHLPHFAPSTVSQHGRSDAITTDRRPKHAEYSELHCRRLGSLGTARRSLRTVVSTTTTRESSRSTPQSSSTRCLTANGRTGLSLALGGIFCFAVGYQSFAHGCLFASYPRVSLVAGTCKASRAASSALASPSAWCRTIARPIFSCTRQFMTAITSPQSLRRILIGWNL